VKQSDPDLVVATDLPPDLILETCGSYALSWIAARPGAAGRLLGRRAIYPDYSESALLAA